MISLIIMGIFYISGAAVFYFMRKELKAEARASFRRGYAAGWDEAISALSICSKVSK